ncbi:MAG TPA: antibiotic biosynthesis monooxygenase family protein [Acidimicrobiia bacterium]|nr:antibiotic biosynthesis monooxygenase family protein [Acidimicrobiia bacterium]
MSVTIVVNFQASEGNGANLLALLRQGRDFSRKAEGCESFEVFQRQDDPNKYMFLEQWTSLDAHHENVAKNVVASGHLAKITALLTEPPDNGVVQAV